MDTHKTIINGGFSNVRQMMGLFWLGACLILLPEFAMANPIQNGVDWVLDLLTNGISRSVAIIACAVLGYMAWVGRLTGEASFKFIGGIVFVFGSASIVDLLIAAVA